jgi:uracil-DNA glycosylase
VSYSAAVDGFLKEQGRDGSASGWTTLPFFSDGMSARVATQLDVLLARGVPVLPPAPDVLAALRLTPPDAVRVVILGQDPYPTPGDAHGLAFSVRDGVAIPRSLRNIFKELEADLGIAQPRSGSLLSWARQGVLLLNACLTVEAGKAAAHRGLGWERLADEVVRHVSGGSPGAVFILWGADAQKKRPLIDEGRHLVIATAHPSPLSARRGFFGSRPFSRANAWLAERGRGGVEWGALV